MPKLKGVLGDNSGKPWKWIDKNCGKIHDKDIEALMRQKLMKDGDKDLLEMIF